MCRAALPNTPHPPTHPHHYNLGTVPGWPSWAHAHVKLCAGRESTTRPALEPMSRCSHAGSWASWGLASPSSPCVTHGTLAAVCAMQDAARDACMRQGVPACCKVAPGSIVALGGDSAVISTTRGAGAGHGQSQSENTPSMAAGCKLGSPNVARTLTRAGHIHVPSTLCM